MLSGFVRPVESDSPTRDIYRREWLLIIIKPQL